MAAPSSQDIVIVSAARTPVGSFNGALSSVPASFLGTVALKAAMERAKVSPDEVNEVILGQVLTAAQGQNHGKADKAQQEYQQSEGGQCLT